MKKGLTISLIIISLALAIFITLFLLDIHCFQCLLGSFENGNAYLKNGTRMVHVCVNNFPDKTFRQFVRSSYCKDGEDTLSLGQIWEITEIDCSGLGIKSLEGIEIFSRLVTLNCSNNRLTNLSISSISSLVEANCSDNELVEIFASSNRNLTTLHCARNKLTRLSISQCKSLRTLDCSDNALTSLQISMLSKPLTYLDCRNNKLKYISANMISGNRTTFISPQYIELAYNPTEGLDVSEELGKPEDILSIVTADGTACEVGETVFFPENTSSQISVTKKVLQDQNKLVSIEAFATLTCRHSFPESFFQFSTTCAYCPAQKLNYGFIAICAVTVLIVVWFVITQEKHNIACETAHSEPEEE